MRDQIFIIAISYRFLNLTKQAVASVLSSTIKGQIFIIDITSTLLYISKYGQTAANTIF